MPDRKFMRGSLLANTHVQMEFHLGGEARSNPEGTAITVTIPVENAHVLAARLLEILAEYGSRHGLPPLALPNGQELVLERR